MLVDVMIANLTWNNAIYFQELEELWQARNRKRRRWILRRYLDDPLVFVSSIS